MTTGPDHPGLARAIEVMDRLRSPGGCPWDAAQTHESLTRYLVEECYEVLDAIEAGDRRLLREELGDLLLQVLFHARLAEELPADEAFDIDAIAGDLADKLVHRHPHVFAPDRSAEPLDAAQLEQTWEAAKVEEKGRTSAVDGVALGQPALALAAKLVARAQRAGVAVVTAPATTDDASELGRQLLDLVEAAVGAGVDPEGALRRAAIEYRGLILTAESDSFTGAETERPAR